MAENETTGGTGSAATGENKTFFEQAQESVGDALDATVQAVKDHPVAAAGIAAGVAAAVGGAAYAASQYLGTDKEPQKGGKKN